MCVCPWFDCEGLSPKIGRGAGKINIVLITNPDV